MEENRYNCVNLHVSGNFMNDIIKIDIVDKSGHDDLKFSIKDLTADLTFDTYYFALACEPYENIQDIKNCVSTFINHWVTEIEQMQDGETRFFPIDISDQYTGCLRVDKKGEELEIAYGTSRTEGNALDINNPSSYFDSITDFNNDISKTLLVRQQDFINSIIKQINSLKN
jgi:hypothetical protein